MPDSFFLKTDDLDLRVTLTSGQVFRWSCCEDKWLGVAGGKQAGIQQVDGGIMLYSHEQDIPFWRNYYDFDYDYKAQRARLGAFPELEESVKILPGIRILNQPFYECLISFIISSCNNIPRIRSIIKKLSESYGRKLEGNYTFPEPSALANAEIGDLMACGTGYRAEYIKRTSGIIAEGFDEKNLISMPLADARKELMNFPGVGAKVADCVLLYSLQKRDAFPVDTWVRKVVHDIYGKDMTDKQIREFADKRFGSDAGLAQQYLFTAARIKAGRKDTVEA